MSENREISISEMSLVSSRARPSTLIATSQSAGWTSLLLEHHRVTADEAPFETVATPDLTLVILTRGEQQLLSLSGGRWRPAVYRAGTIGMTPANASDRLRRRVRPGAEPCEKANLYIPQSIMSGAAELYRRAGAAVRSDPMSALAFQDPLIAQLVSTLLRGMKAGELDLYAQAAAQTLALHLVSAHSPWLGRGQDGRDPGVIADRRLARVIEYMTLHLAESLSLERLATEAGVSKFHFTRLFRLATGSTPNAFLLQLKMEAACRMLSATDLPVGDIAVRCGFARAEHFSAAFAKRLGQSPSAYRARRDIKALRLN